MGLERLTIRVTGVVQGVGFRPFVHHLATELGVAGLVRNESAGVRIEAEATPAALDAFVKRLQRDAPRAALVESIETRKTETQGTGRFEIVVSEAGAGSASPAPADLATCDECLRELFDPHDRRYRYPFLNCTNCGPRFTIIRGIPYDRPLTTMASFAMCSECAREYSDPADRRFHAQPNACPQCGPRLWFEPHGGEPVEAARAMLACGGIVAVKGIGGFHLACDGLNETAVAALRARKRRGAKPFAMMARDLETVRRYARVSDDEARLLASRERPIVLLERAEHEQVAPSVAPGQTALGFMLAYSPLHHLLTAGGQVLVMTSGNLSDEPIARTNEEARARLSALADAFLFHDREIHTVCDDSVVRVACGAELPLRRSRGYAPLPLRLPFESAPPLLAVGGELKATFCLSHGRRGYLSQHVGDMENAETLTAFERAVRLLESLYRIRPEWIACDLHPGYISSVWAKSQGLPVSEVQHHHAHAAGLMAEHGMAEDERIMAVAFDGTGLGTDRAVWGGELLEAGYADFTRLGHLKYVPLAGGDTAVRRPYRMAVAHARAAGIEWEPPAPAPERALLRRQLESGMNAPPTSSMGRLFDAAASLAGVRHVADYEAQAAMEFEALADVHSEGAYRFAIETRERLVFDPAPAVRELVGDVHAGVAAGAISMRFHRAVANVIADLCTEARGTSGIGVVGLTGGVFQNVLLARLATESLAARGFRVLVHRLTPPNDGGLAYGQAAVARARLR